VEVSIFSSLTPLLLCAPTQQTTALPTPVITNDYERRNGSGLSKKFFSLATYFLAALISFML
jgi:hypothetical protein